MDTPTKDALQEFFGYVPNEQDGEKWVVYKNRILIVTHWERRPRLYERGCNGCYVELEPDLR